MRVGFLVFLSVFLAAGQDQNSPSNVRELITAGNQALEKNQLHEAAEMFQKALDLNPSSAKANEGLGVALAKGIISGNTRPSDDSDAADRAENHLRQAAELAPSATRPLIQLAELEKTLAEQSTDRNAKADRYAKAQDALKRSISLDSSRADLYLQLAMLERDQFGPAIQKAKLQGNKASGSGPIADEDWRRDLQQKYGALVDDAISNAHSAADLDAHSTKALLLMARMLRERAQLRNSQQDYSGDMHSADDWQRQFLAAGGHLEQTDSSPR